MVLESVSTMVGTGNIIINSNIIRCLCSENYQMDRGLVNDECRSNQILSLDSDIIT